jgi:hypothetical protein
MEAVVQNRTCLFLLPFAVMRLPGLLLLVAIVGAHPLTAQERSIGTGNWTACFRTREAAAHLACGVIGLGVTSTCPHRADGQYDIPFDRLIFGDSTLKLPSFARITWQQPSQDSLTIEGWLSAGETPEGEPICPIAPEGGLEAGGRISGDSLFGNWGWRRWEGEYRPLGTFVMRRPE